MLRPLCRLWLLAGALPHSPPRAPPLPCPALPCPQMDFSVLVEGADEDKFRSQMRSLYKNRVGTKAIFKARGRAQRGGGAARGALDAAMAAAERWNPCPC